MEKTNKLRVNISMEKVIVDKIDKYAKYNGISRGGAMSVLCNFAVEQMNFMQEMPALMELAKNEKIEQ